MKSNDLYDNVTYLSTMQFWPGATYFLENSVSGIFYWDRNWEGTIQIALTSMKIPK